MHTLLIFQSHLVGITTVPETVNGDVCTGFHEFVVNTSTGNASDKCRPEAGSGTKDKISTMPYPSFY